MPWKEVTSLVRRVATMEAMWTKGPSFPRGIPEPRVAVRPTTFATRVLGGWVVVVVVVVPHNFTPLTND